MDPQNPAPFPPLPPAQTPPPRPPAPPLSPLPPVPPPPTHHDYSEYLTDLLAANKKFPVFLAALVSSLILAIYPSIQVVMVARHILNRLPSQIDALVKEVVPADLKITIKNGQASSNVTEPYYLTVNQSSLEKIIEPPSKSSQVHPQSKIRLLTLDCNANPNDFERYQSYALLTQKSLVYFNDGDIKLQSLNTTPNMQISQKLILDKIREFNKDNRAMNFLNGFLFAFPVIIVLGFTLAFLGQVFWLTLLAYLMNRILVAGYKFGVLYGLTGLVFSLPYLAAHILQLIPGVAVFSNWLTTLLNVVVLAVVYVVISTTRIAPEDPQ